MTQSSQWSAESFSRHNGDSDDFGGNTTYVSAKDAPERSRAPQERGLPGYMALGVLLVIAGIGGLIDQLGGADIKGGFAIGLIVASFISIILVRRSDMFTIVIAPPLVYFAASAALLYVRSGGLHNRKVLIDYASQWLVYGFPAIAGATAVVLLIAGFRIATRR